MSFRLASAVFMVTSFSACAGGNDLPVAYSVCPTAGGACVQVARFKDVDTCESYRKISGALCDWTTPGKVTCNTKWDGSGFSVGTCSP